MSNSPINQGTATGAGTLTTPGSTAPPIYVSRADQLMKAQGGIAETVAHQVANTPSAVTVSGTLYGTQVYLEAGDVITNVSVQSGSSVTPSQTSGLIGIYDQSGNLLASIADTGAAWSTQGIHTHPLLAPLIIATSGIYYAAMLVVAATLPVMNFGTIPSTVRLTFNPIAGFPIYFWTQTGLSALPNPAAQPYTCGVSGAALGGMPWILLS